MKNFLLLALSGLLFCASCQQDASQEELITGKWQAIKIDNPQLADLIKSQQTFVDTFGKNNTPAQNMAAYGFTNVDSFRRVLQGKIDSFIKIQQSTIDNTVFAFGKDKIAILNFDGYVDSAKWSLDTAGMLVLDDRAMKPQGDVTTMDIISLTKDTLKLKFTETGVTSIAIFKSVDK